ncbi:MAG TPA: nuclear transport factor 2 family protein [Anaerolineae bacterium]|nr:nuclear transport factor 2 family protein [Anaerolineae bacterium]MCB0223537.1 nuclear transport factor 2 family protein [Anaerolineae bacterium]HRV93898.1 nuclear transport factor 2 family protein [Anaerolineae bacterium]
MSTITINNTQEKMTIKAALAEFFEALNAMFTGDLAPMEALWSHADDVTYMGPAGGYRVGWAEVRADWAEQAALKLGGEVKPSEIRITKADNLAAAQYYVVGENFDPNGNPMKVSLRANSLYRQENGQWKIIAIHTDMLPFLVSNNMAIGWPAKAA